MPIKPEKYYKPRHQYNYNVTPNMQAQVSGGGGTISTGYDTTLGKQVTGKIKGITTTNVIVSYNVNIQYTGPVNIGDRTIQNTQIVSKIQDAANIKQAQKNTGISDPDSDSCGYKIFACITLLTCTCCLFRCCFDAHHKDRREQLDSEIKRLDEESVSKQVAEMLKAADDQIDQRIKYAQQNQLPSGTGTQGQGEVKITKEQYQQFQQFQQFQQMQQMQQMAPPQQYGTSPSMLPQYSQQGVQLVPNRKASNSTNPPGYVPVPTNFPTASAPPAYATKRM